MFKIVFFVSICILIIWAIIATVFAVKNSKDARSCSKSLNVANSQVDSCNSFCGAKGAWTVGQVSQIGGLIVNVLKTQTVVSCGNPSVSYPLLSSCVADKVSKSNSYWNITGGTNPVASIAVISSTLKDCVSSVPDCKINK